MRRTIDQPRFATGGFIKGDLNINLFSGGFLNFWKAVPDEDPPDIQKDLMNFMEKMLEQDPPPQQIIYISKEEFDKLQFGKPRQLRDIDLDFEFYKDRMFQRGEMQLFFGGHQTGKTMFGIEMIREFQHYSAESVLNRIYAVHHNLRNWKKRIVRRAKQIPDKQVRKEWQQQQRRMNRMKKPGR